MRVPLAKYPGMNRFVLDWLDGDERFLPRSAGAPVPARPAHRVSGSLVEALRESNQRWGVFAGDALVRWASGGTLTIIAGQQVGFAGGPLYTLAKLASIVRFKRDMEKQGIPVTAFFWLATEDHDYDEVATLNVPVAHREVDLLRIRAVRSADRAGKPVVGPLPIPEELITQFLAQHDIPRPAWLRPGITFGDSFAELIAATFGSEVILVDALLPELRRAGAPLFEQILANHDRIQRVLHDRAEELEAAGYQEQVIAREGSEYTLLFELDDQGNRQPLITNRQPAPERTSTSALTRPLLQDALFRPDIFLGGPAEVAYYAQVNVLHELFGIPQPRVALRGHVLVAPKRVARAFERYGIDPAEVFRSTDEILAGHEPEGVARIRELRDEGRRELLKRVEQIGELALPADHSLASSIQRSIGHLEFHFDKLAERAVKGLVRKDRERYAALRELAATLYPDRHVQDRVVSWYSYVCQHGSEVIERIIEEVEPDSAFFKVVSL